MPSHVAWLLVVAVGLGASSADADTPAPTQRPPARRSRARSTPKTPRRGPRKNERPSTSPATPRPTPAAPDLGRATTGACNITACLAGTREGRRLERSAHRFGFVLRYPVGGHRMTGYAHESWHFRLVGRPLATYLRRERIPTLEEAFGLVGAGS